MANKKVQLNFITDIESNNIDNFVYWPATQRPFDPKFFLNKDNPKKLLSENNGIQFESFSDASTEEFNYFVAKLDSSGQLICKPAQIYRMMPNFALKDISEEQNKDSQKILTKREQFEELNRKFGSKKSQRNFANKGKRLMQFGAEDVDDLPNILNQDNSENVTADIKEEKAKLSDILPERDNNAKSVDKVYLIENIISDIEYQSILEYERELFDSIKEEYFKQLGTIENGQKQRVMAIYCDILLQLLKLNTWQMRKADPLPLIVGDIKKHIFEKYTLTKQTSREMRYVITDQNKDRILVYICILIITLNNYKPIELSKFECLKVSLVQIRKLLELIGCYVKKRQNINGTVASIVTFSLPLNVINNKRFKK